MDHQFQLSGFDKNRLFYTQGDYGLFQCSKGCHQKTYDNRFQIEQMMERQQGLKIPTELIPHCPVCGTPMTVNLRCDDTFVQDEGWYAASKRYDDFIRRHSNMRILYLELGVGGNTPVFCSLRTGKSETKTLRKQRNSGHLQILTIDYAERRCA